MTNKIFKQGYALIVGVGADLPETVNDANGLAGILRDPGRCAYPAGQVNVLTEENATRERILDGLEALSRSITDDSTVIIYFSGHGYKLASGEESRYYLFPFGYDSARLNRTAISGSEFTERLAGIKARKLLLLLDCCHAGGFDLAKAPGFSKAPVPPEAKEFFLKGSGKMLIASSRENELSFGGRQYSAFTTALIESLVGKGVSRKDGYVRVGDLAMYVGRRVAELTKGRQNPCLDFAKADNFVVAYYSGGAKEPKVEPYLGEIEIEPEPGAWRSLIDQRGQQVTGTQTNFAGPVSGPVISGPISGDVHISMRPSEPKMRPPDSERFSTGKGGESGWDIGERGGKPKMRPTASAQPLEETGDESGWQYPVYFGTNREPIDAASPGLGFSGERSKTVHYGRCVVFIPRTHKFGSIGTPWWKRWLSLQLADDHLCLKGIKTLEEQRFWWLLQAQIKMAEAAPQCLVYLHGYNTSFDDAAIRAAQIGFDLKIDGATAFFSWPSNADKKNYAADKAAIEASEDEIASFLADIARQSGAAKVHIIAHSMGNMGLLRAIQRIVADAEAAAKVKFGQVFLAAPDVDVDLFTNLARLVPTCSERVTLYSSKRDIALAVSSWLHGFPRAGYYPPVAVVPGIDTITVPNFNIDLLGHSYYAEADALLNDMFVQMHFGTPPAQRQRLSKEKEWWKLLP